MSRIMLATPTDLEPGPGGVTLVVPDDYLGESVRLRIVEGRYPSAADEIAISEKAAQSGYKVGDTVSMHVLTPGRMGECMDGALECAPEPAGEATITGLLRLPDDLAPSPLDGGGFVAPLSFLTAAGGDDAAFGFITELHIAEGVDADEFAAGYSPQIVDGDVANADGDVADARRAAELQHDALLIGSAIAAGAGLLIGSQAFGRVLARRTNDASRLRAVGMTSRQRVSSAVGAGGRRCGIGAFGAIPIAVALSPMFPLRIARRADPDVGFHADWTVIAVSSA